MSDFLGWAQRLPEKGRLGGPCLHRFNNTCMLTNIKPCIVVRLAPPLTNIRMVGPYGLIYQYWMHSNFENLLFFEWCFNHSVQVSIKEIGIYCDFKQDESYTPSKISIRAGTHFHDLQVPPIQDHVSALRGIIFLAMKFCLTGSSRSCFGRALRVANSATHSERLVPI